MSSSNVLKQLFFISGHTLFLRRPRRTDHGNDSPQDHCSVPAADTGDILCFYFSLVVHICLSIEADIGDMSGCVTPHSTWRAARLHNNSICKFEKMCHVL